MSSWAISAKAQDGDTCLWIDSDSTCFAMPQGNFPPHLQTGEIIKNFMWCTETKHELSMDGFTKQLTQEHE